MIAVLTAEDREQAQGEQGAQPVATAPYPPRIGEPIQDLTERSKLLRRAGQTDVPAVALQDADHGG